MCVSLSFLQGDKKEIPIAGLNEVRVVIREFSEKNRGFRAKRFWFWFQAGTC